MEKILLLIVALSVFAVAVFLISFILEARRTIISLRKTTEEKLIPVLEELTISLRNIKNISETVNVVTADVKTLTNSLGNIGRTINSIGDIVEGTKFAASVRVASFGTGVKVALLYFITHLFRKGE